MVANLREDDHRRVAHLSYVDRLVTDWHIMSNKVMKTVASQCPTTLDELKAVDGLGQKKFEEYGERLVKNILNFVETENLQDLLSKKKGSRPTKVRRVASDDTHGRGATSTSVKHSDDVDDEFPLGFDESELLNI